MASLHKHKMAACDSMLGSDVLTSFLDALSLDKII